MRKRWIWGDDGELDPSFHRDGEEEMYKKKVRAHAKKMD